MATSSDAVSFEVDIEPLFDQRDQEAMLIVFDLWNVEDVRAHADAILEQVESGGMPCYERRPEERVDLVRRWMAGGMQE